MFKIKKEWGYPLPSGRKIRDLLKLFIVHKWPAGGWLLPAPQRVRVCHKREEDPGKRR